MIPLGVILISCLVFVYKKKWMIVTALSVVLAKFLVVVLTQPTGWLMYYLSFYLMGYIILVQGCFLLSYKRKATRENLVYKGETNE